MTSASSPLRDLTLDSKSSSSPPPATLEKLQENSPPLSPPSPGKSTKSTSPSTEDTVSMKSATPDSIGAPVKTPTGTSISPISPLSPTNRSPGPENTDQNADPIAEYLLGKFPFLRSDYEHHPLFPSAILWVSRFGHYPAARWLIEQGVDPTQPNTSPMGKLRTPLHYAALYGHKELLAYLIIVHTSASYPLDTPRDLYGFTPLHLACIEPQTQVIRILIQHGASPTVRTSSGDTALHIAAKTASEEAVELLVEGGADPNVRNIGGYTPLMIAAELGNEEAILKLAEYEPDLDVQAEWSGDTALHMAVRGAHLTAVVYLLRMGAQYGIRNFCGRRVLDYGWEDMPRLRRREAIGVVRILRGLLEGGRERFEAVAEEETGRGRGRERGGGGGKGKVLGAFTVEGVKRGGSGRKSVYDEEDEEEEESWESAMGRK